MPAQSRAQQKLMGLVHAVQQGKTSAPSSKVAKMAKSMKPTDVKAFASTKHKGLPAHKSESTIGELISRYNEYGSRLRNGISMRDLAEELLQIAEFAEQTVMSEADDWFDGHTVKRNMKEMKNYVSEFAKIANEYDTLGHRATALYDDMGRVLERYFEISDDNPMPQEYDTDGDGEPDLEPDNSPKDPVDPDQASQMAHEDTWGGQMDADMEDDFDDDNAVEESGEAFKHLTRQLAGKGARDPKALAAWIGRKKLGKAKFQKKAAAGRSENACVHGEECNCGMDKNEDLVERLITVARHRLTGEQLSKFDTLPKPTQIRAAWRIVR